MRLLLIAYEFPPSPSPQSLRWTYLARELAAHGHEVHVLTADLGGTTPGLPALPDTVQVHRTFPGPVRGMMSVLRKRAARKAAATASAGTTPAAPPDAGAPLAPPIRPPRNWKQRISEAIQAIAAYIHFPDLRGEWLPWGRRALRRLLHELQPDLVISSHEPATTLQLGLLAQRAGFRWHADLGDPVLAPYTPARWRGRSRRLERAVCQRADLITVTSQATAILLRERHGRTGPIQVITQGFDASRPPAVAGRAATPLRLLYTGSFYAFRRADALLDAVTAQPGVRLEIAAVTVPEDVLAAARRAPDRIRLLGFMPHSAALDLQRQADVLVNIANADMTQVPGKIYEYLGSGRPVLHLGSPDDAVGALLARTGRGWTCANEPAAIRQQLAALCRAGETGALAAGLSHDPETVAGYSWQSIGSQLDMLLRDNFDASAIQPPP